MCTRATRQYCEDAAIVEEFGSSAKDGILSSYLGSWFIVDVVANPRYCVAIDL